MSTNIKPMSVPTKRLSNSITSIATSMTLNNITDWAGNDLTATSFSNSTGWPIVFRNETNTLLEFAEIDTTTLSGNSYDVTKRGLSYDGGHTSGEGSSLDWNAIETIVELGSNPPQLYEDYTDHTSNESVTGTWTITSTGQWVFNRLPSINATPVSSSDVATKGYVDGIGISPTPYAANVISGNGSTSYSKGSLIYYSSSDQLWYPTAATLTSSFQNKTLGITQSTSNTSGDTISILIGGNSTSVSTGMTPGTKYYLGDTTGTLGTTSTYEVYAGYALSSTNFLFEQRRDDMPFAYEKDALAGLAISTSAVPATANPYLTKYDTTSAVTTGCLIPLRNSTGDIIVNTTPQSGDAAASKTYADNMSTAIEIGLNNQSINTITGAGNWITVTTPAITSSVISGWTLTSGVTGAGILNTKMPNLGNTTSDYYAYIPIGRHDAGSCSDVLVTFGTTGSLKTKFAASLGTGTLNVRYAFGLVNPGGTTGMESLISTASAIDCVKFLFNSSGTDTLLAITANGTTATFTDITSSINIYNTNIFEIEWNPTTSAKFYVNGNLMATHSNSSSLSTGGSSGMTFGYNVHGSVESRMVCSPVTVSYQI